MYDNGLQDNELQTFHKSLKYTGNFTLAEIQASDYFHVTTNTGNIIIIPLFYTDEILCDWENVAINSPYQIIVPTDFNGIITFKGNDDQVISNRAYDLQFENNYYIIAIYNADTNEILLNQPYKIVYSEHDPVQRTTSNIGYDTFIPLEEEFEVVL